MEKMTTQEAFEEMHKASRELHKAIMDTWLMRYMVKLCDWLEVKLGGRKR